MKQTPKPKKSDELPTLEDLENMAKAMFDQADRKARLDKRKGWKSRGGEEVKHCI